MEKSGWASMIGGYSLVILAYILHVPIRMASQAIDNLPRIYKVILEDIYMFIAFFGTLNVWRAFWIVCDVFVFPEMIPWKVWATPNISILVLMACLAGNSVLVRGSEIVII